MSTGAPSNGISTKEYIEEILSRIEGSVNQQISGLREDIKHLQNNYITRHEHDAVVGQMQRDIERLEREQRDGLGRVEKLASEELKEFKDDLRGDQNRMLGVLAFAIGAIEFVSRIVIK